MTLSFMANTCSKKKICMTTDQHLFDKISISLISHGNYSLSH